MNVIALDPGTQRTGYAVLSATGQSPKLIECDLIKLKGKALPDRLLHLHKELEKIFKRSKPGQVAIERPFVGKSGRDALTLGAGRAICMLAAAGAKAPVFEYAPSQIKKTVTGNGQASKEQVQRMVKLIFRLDETPQHDAADALALALCHVNRLH